MVVSTAKRNGLLLGEFTIEELVEDLAREDTGTWKIRGHNT
jgi:hypothetical protein